MRETDVRTARRWFTNSENACPKCGFNNVLGWNCQVKVFGLAAVLRCGNCEHIFIPDQTVPQREIGIQKVYEVYT